MPGSPTLRRRRLARELVRLREAGGLTIEQAAASAGISASHLSRVERALVGVRLPVVKALLGTYDADEGTARYLVKVAQEASQRGWWHSYVGSIPEQYATYIGFEAEAEQIWSFDANTIPGLLQTEAYTRAVIQGGATRFSAEAINNRVELRVQRQALLTAPEPPRLWIVLDESAVRRQVGGRETLVAQLHHIVQTAALPHVDVQVLPFEVGAHPGLPGSFTVLSFAEAADLPVVYVETMAGDLYPEGQEQISGITLAFDRLRAMALSPEDSVAVIRGAIKEMT